MLVNLSCRKDNELNSIWSRKNLTLDWSVLYLEIFAMIRLLTSYSKDKRRKDAKYWSLSRKVKGQHSWNSLVALSFWQNIFTPLNHICIHLCKQVKDDDSKTPRTSKDKKILVKVNNGCFPNELCVFVIFVNSASIRAPYMQLVIKVWWTFYVLEYSLSIASIILHA